MSLANELFVLLVGNHHHALFALLRDELRTLGTGASIELAKAGFGGLQLPTGVRRSFSALPRCTLGTLNLGIRPS